MDTLRKMHENIMSKMKNLNNNTLPRIETLELVMDVLELMDAFAELGPTIKHHDEELKVMLQHQFEVCP